MVTLVAATSIISEDYPITQQVARRLYRGGPIDGDTIRICNALVAIGAELEGEPIKIIGEGVEACSECGKESRYTTKRYLMPNCDCDVLQWLGL